MEGGARGGRRLSAELCDAVRGFLKWESLNRLGCLTDGASDVKQHPFFAVEDWEALLAQTRPPPFVPTLSDPTDTRNFDDAVADGSFLNEPEYDYSKNECTPAEIKPADVAARARLSHAVTV